MQDIIEKARRYAGQWLGQGAPATFIPELTKQDPRQLGISITNSRITTCGDNTLNLILQVRLKEAIPFRTVMQFMDEHPEIKSLSI